jgi:hypothetical protein
MEKKIMEQKDYEIAKELKEKLSEIVPLIGFRVLSSGGVEYFLKRIGGYHE